MDELEEGLMMDFKGHLESIEKKLDNLTVNVESLRETRAAQTEQIKTIYRWEDTHEKKHEDLGGWLKWIIGSLIGIGVVAVGALALVHF